MDKIIEAINNTVDLEKKVKFYCTLTDDQKRALLESLKNERYEDTGIFLNAISPRERNKKIHKLIRRLLFRLRSLGVHVEGSGPSGETVLRKVDEIREHHGFMTNFDPTGSRLVMACYEIRKNAFLFLNGELHLNQGLRELMSAPVDRKGFEEIITAYRGATKEPAFLTEISPVYAAFIVEEGSNRSGRFQEEIKPLRSFVVNLKDAVRKPSDIYLLPVPDGTGTPSMAEVLQHPLFTSFLISWEKIEEDRRAYLAEETTAIILPQRMMEEKRVVFLKNLSQRVDINSRIPLVKRMLEDYAYFFHRTGEYTYYKGTLALATDNALTDVLIYFLKKVLDKTEKKLAVDGLIVSPYE